jgi:hypothetical protein
MLHILVDSNSGDVLLAKLLQAEQQAGSIRIRSSKIRSSLYGSARGLLVVRKEPVAVVLDADSTRPGVADLRRQDAEEVIGKTAGAAPLKILVAVPALEALVFLRPDAVARAYGPVPQSLIELGLASPWTALEKLDRTASSEQVSLNIIEELDSADVTALRAESPVRELLEFLGEVQHHGAVAVATAP